MISNRCVKVAHATGKGGGLGQQGGIEDHNLETMEPKPTYQPRLLPDPDEKMAVPTDTPIPALGRASRHFSPGKRASSMVCAISIDPVCINEGQCAISHRDLGAPLADKFQHSDSSTIFSMLADQIL